MAVQEARTSNATTIRLRKSFQCAWGRTHYQRNLLAGLPTDLRHLGPLRILLHKPISFCVRIPHPRSIYPTLRVVALHPSQPSLARALRRMRRLLCRHRDFR